MAEKFESAAQSSSREMHVRRWRIWVMLIVAPLLWLGLWWLSRALDITSRARITLTTDILLLAWVISWLRSQGHRLADIGLTTNWLGREIFFGVLAGLGLWLGAQLPVWGLHLIGIRWSYQRLVMGDWLTQLVCALGIAICEEIVWRGYVLTEFHRLYRLSISVALGVIAFTIFHISGAVTFHWVILPLMLYLGGWLSVLYLWRRSLVAPIVARFVLGLLGLL